MRIHRPATFMVYARRLVRSRSHRQGCFYLVFKLGQRLFLASNLYEEIQDWDLFRYWFSIVKHKYDIIIIKAIK